MFSVSEKDKNYNPKVAKLIDTIEDAELTEKQLEDLKKAIANKQTSKTNRLVYPVHCLSSRKHGTLRIGRSSDFPRKQRLPELTVALSCCFF